MNQAARNLLQKLFNIHICTHCNKIQTVVDPLVCSCCTTAVYCGQSCQQQDWIAHQSLVGVKTGGAKKRDNSDDENPDTNKAPTKKPKESKDAEISLSLLEKLPLDLLRLLTGLGNTNDIRNISTMSKKLNLAALDVAQKQLWWTFPATKSEFETVLANMKTKLVTVEFYNVKLRKPEDRVWLRENGLWSRIRKLYVDFEYDEDENSFNLQGLDNCLFLKIDTRSPIELDFAHVPKLTTLEIGNNFRNVLNLGTIETLTEFKFEEGTEPHQRYPHVVNLQGVPNLQTLSGCTNTFVGIETLTRLTYLQCGQNFTNPLDLSRLTNLQTLKLENQRYFPLLKVSTLVKLETLIGGCNFNGLSNAMDLKLLQLGNCNYIDPIEDLQYLTSLTILRTGDDYNHPLNVTRLVNLTELTTGNNFDNSIIGLGNLKRLKVLTFGSAYDQEDGIESLQQLTSLETLIIGEAFDYPLNVGNLVNLETVETHCRLIGLGRLVKLKTLRVMKYFDATMAGELNYLTNLEYFYMGAHKFEGSLNVSQLVNLEKLIIAGVYFNSRVIGLENLKRLQLLSFGPSYNRKVEQLDQLVALKYLRFDISGDFNQPLNGLERLTRLEELHLGPAFYQPALALPNDGLKLISCSSKQYRAFFESGTDKRPGLKIERYLFN